MLASWSVVLSTARVRSHCIVDNCTVAVESGCSSVARKTVDERWLSWRLFPGDRCVNPEEGIVSNGGGSGVFQLQILHRRWCTVRCAFANIRRPQVERRVCPSGIRLKSSSGVGCTRCQLLLLSLFLQCGCLPCLRSCLRC